MVRSALRVALALCLLAALADPGLAQGPPTGSRPDKGQNQPGQFDFYVLSLSWSPSYCAAAAERGAERGAALQCGARPYSFVVHGLWPQYERGFPQYCQVPAPRLNRAIVSSMLDLMPAPHLIFNEWDRHGTCSGMSPRAYFATVRQARAAVKIPADYVDLQKPLGVAPSAVEDAFIKANPDLAQGDIAVDCDKKRLTEIRLCLSKDLKFRACPQIVRRSCRREQILMPPLRGVATGAGGAG
jgi:ribonuclease T2